MDELAFWRQKIIQFFHDPPAKPFAGTGTTGKQVKVAKDLFNAFQRLNEDRKLSYWYRSADWATAGADRPMLYVPKKKGVSGIGTVRWPNDPQITHPLSPGARLLISTKKPDLPEKENDFEDDSGQPRDPIRDPINEQLGAIEKFTDLPKTWRQWEDLQKAFFALWRRFRDELVSNNENAEYRGDHLWEEMPADSRSPDHSLWDHLKVTTALAFMKPHKYNEEPKGEGAQEPWMLRFALGPTQEFIEQSRTSRDLWISSFLLADFSWHAMQPFVERYGPDCIVYPDLRANPRADCWLFDSHQYALPENEKNPSTFAAVLPGVFVSLVPRGGQGHLETIESLANQAANNVNERWTSLAKVVQQWFQEHTCWNQLCAQIWTRQTRKPPICCTWTALPWRCMERINDPKNLTGRALPAQRKDFRQPAPGPAAENDRQAMESRRKRLSPWVPQKVWGHYELAREVFARSCLDLHQMERGFDYALTHHQLGARHALRKATDPAATVSEEPGEKCTLCGQREALRNEDNGDSRLDNVRALAREFWRNKELDPDQTGSERLCAVCAVKRFLVRADKTETNIGSFNQLWAGMSTPLENIVDHDGELRIPFPSTCAIAGQKFLKEVTKDHRLKPEIAAVIAACRQAKRPRTSFPRALPRLAVLHRDCGKEAQEFLEYEVQEVIFPETADGKAQALRAKNEDASKMDKLKEVKEAVSRLREKATELSIKPPNSQIAVIRVDGDNMGKLLLGSEDIIATRWKDVLHPKALVRLRENTHLRAAGWEDLLESKRLMGPSLHAFVSRTLGHFSHCIVPWVVEQEFSGRLIYSGGDNVLCLAPADEALDLAARLQQLFSAAWVVDTDPRNKQDQWAWRRKDWKGEYTQEKARKRLVIPLPGNQGTRPIELSNDGQLVATHTSEDDDSPRQQSVQGALLPMLGTSASLSAGIAIGHYKTPLSALLRRSKELQEFAKEPFKEDASKDASERNWKGRNALAIGHASRGGEKTRFALPWNNDSSKGCPTANLILREVVVGFKKGDLPNSLPYKLRELALSARCGLDCIGKDEKTSDQLLKGLFNSCLENSKGKFADAAFKVWKQGIYLQRSSTSKNPESKYTDGLLLCRALALGSDTCQGEE